MHIHTHTYVYTHTRTHAHTHARTHARTHAHTHTHTHTHTHRLASVMSDSFDPMDYSPPGSPVHGEILQAKILEWVAVPYSR